MYLIMNITKTMAIYRRGRPFDASAANLHKKQFIKGGNLYDTALRNTGDKKIWTDENRFGRWLDVELAATQAWNEAGVVPDGDFKNIKEKPALTLSESAR